MKALSLRQPWANAVLHLGKHIENRRWNTSFRGQFLIHAAKGMTLDEYRGAIEFCADALLSNVESILASVPRMNLGALPLGGIVGLATIVDVLPPCPLCAKYGILAARSCPKHHSSWHMTEQFGFVLEDIKPLPFVPMIGALGFHRVPDDVMARIAL